VESSRPRPSELRRAAPPCRPLHRNELLV